MNKGDNGVVRANTATDQSAGYVDGFSEPELLTIRGAIVSALASLTSYDGGLGIEDYDGVDDWLRAVANRFVTQPRNSRWRLIEALQIIDAERYDRTSDG